MDCLHIGNGCTMSRKSKNFQFCRDLLNLYDQTSKLMGTWIWRMFYCFVSTCIKSTMPLAGSKNVVRSFMTISFSGFDMPDNNDH